MAALLPGQTTLAAIRQKARERADRVINGAPLFGYPDPYGNSFITTPELNGYINESAGELYELLINQFANFWSTAQVNFTSLANTEQYDVPLDMQKLLSVEWVQSPGSTVNNVVLRRFNFNERDYFNLNAFAPPVFSLGNCLYSLFGSKIWLKPLPQAGLTFLVSYVPKPLLLIDSGTVTMNSVTAGDALTIVLDDVSHTLTAIAHGGTPTSTQFVVGGTGSGSLGDAGTAQSLTDTINALLGGPAGVMAAIPTPLSGSTTGTATVTVLLTGPGTVTWSASNSHLVLDPNSPTGALATGPITWSNIFQAYAGLDEYLVCDAAIKMTQKEQSSVDVLMAQKVALIERYRQNYTNRDPGQPRTITNTRRSRYGPMGQRWGR